MAGATYVVCHRANYGTDAAASTRKNENTWHPLPSAWSGAVPRLSDRRTDGQSRFAGRTIPRGFSRAREAERPDDNYAAVLGAEPTRHAAGQVPQHRRPNRRGRPHLRTNIGLFLY